VIQCDKYRIFMAHILKGSYLAKEGDNVKPGQPLARLGNSGFTVEPHLHIQAYTDYNKTGDLLPGRSVPMLFRDRFLSLNELFTEKE
nr:M23 family metallopeptidase [Bacteroidota bacterium]